MINHSHCFLLQLLGGSEHIIHALEAVFPAADLSSDVPPFFFAYLAQHVAVNDQLTVNLVNLSVNNFVSDSFDSPLFNVILRNVKESRHFRVLEVSGLVSAQLADLLVALFEDHLGFRDAFLLENSALLAQLGFKVFSVCSSEAGQ